MTESSKRTVSFEATDGTMTLGQLRAFLMAAEEWGMDPDTKIKARVTMGGWLKSAEVSG